MTAMKMFGQFIDSMVPVLAFLLFAVSEGVVIYYFLKMTGIIS